MSMTKSEGYVCNAYRDGRLGEQITKLENLGFEWRERKKRSLKVGQLIEWKQQHGHLDIPYSDPKLGDTTSTTNQEEQGEMSDSHEEALSNIGFGVLKEGVPKI